MQLDKFQSDAFGHVFKGRNVFITGGAGSGKSHLIRALVEHRLVEEENVTAMTGVAACLIGGCTLHSWSAIGIDDSARATAICGKMSPKVKLRVARGAIADVLADVLANHAVEDVSVEDRPLEEAIAEMFSLAE